MATRKSVKADGCGAESDADIAKKSRGSRLKAERERLGYTIAQVAALVGLTTDAYLRAEEGDTTHVFDKQHELYDVGIDMLYVGVGGRTKNLLSPSPDNLGHDGPEFRSAIRLMRRSAQAVDAFMGDGTAARCPELVSALMQSVVSMSYSPTAGQFEDFSETVDNALSGIAEELAALNERFADGN